MSFPEYTARSASAHSVRSIYPTRRARATRQMAPAQVSLSPFMGAVSCPVCEAVYAPTQAHESLLHAPAIALESAFMSMCRFCFRCRRPSCPACWDAVNGLCGACVEELALPFRQPLHPFENALPLPAPMSNITTQRAASTPALPPAPSAALVTANEDPLSCVYAGRFEQSSTATPASLPPVPRVTNPILTTQRNSARNTVVPQSTPSTSSSVTPSSKPLRASRAAHSFELVFVTLFLLALTLAIVLVITTSLFPQVNTWLIHIFHIDIHALVLMVWSSLRHLFGW